MNTIEVEDIELQKEYEQWLKDHPIWTKFLSLLIEFFILGTIALIISGFLYAIRLITDLWISWMIVCCLLYIKLYYGKSKYAKNEK